MRSQRQPSFSSEEEVPFIKPELPAHNARWGVHYASPSMMIGFFVAGLFCASFHNSFYQSLDTTETGTSANQQWALRVGMGLAFATKASFAATIGIAFTQYLWVVTRRQYMSLSALDAMFSLTSTPISFYNWEVFTKATVLFLVACSMWSMPLLATFSPGTLSVKDEMKTSVHSAWVFTLNIVKTYKHHPEAWHRTENGAIAGASLLLLRLLARTAASMSIVSATDQGMETYNMTFHGPALKCLTLSDAILDPMMKNPGPHYNTLQDAWDATDMSLNGNYYKGAVNELTNNYIFIRTTERNLTCNLWNATYEGDFSVVHHYDQASNYYLQECHVKGLRGVQLLAPTNYSISNNISDYPPGGGAYQSIFLALSSLLVTELGPNFGRVGENPLLMSSQLAYCPEIPDYGMWKYWNRAEMCPGRRLSSAIEQLSHNFTMSLVNSRGHNWEMSSEASISYQRLVYTYDSKMLTTVYLSGAAITFCCLLLGLWSYHVNGYSATNSFSTILFTTRNRDLDEVSAAHCLGSHPLPEDVASVKLRFGNIGENHIAFGLKDTVTRLRKGQACH